MSIARIGEFNSAPQRTEELLAFLRSILPIIQSSRGCESVQLYQNHEDPTRFTMIEIWDSIESHRASVKNIPSEKLAEIQPLLGDPPKGSYYDPVPAE